MHNPGEITGSSMSSLLREYSTISHNLSNINTSGYKKKVGTFSRELMNQVTGKQDKRETGGAIEFDTHMDHTQGSLMNTHRSLDVAIGGKGFFMIDTPQGPRYTRQGVFHVNPDTGQLTDIAGKLVSGVNGPIIVPPNVSELEINVAEDGSVSARGINLGQLRVVDFGANEDQLIPAGDNYLVAPEGVVPGESQSKLHQGFRENSNVQLMDEMVNMMSVSRLYEMNMRILMRKREQSRAMIDVAKSG